jgi:hypothetical protein
MDSISESRATRISASDDEAPRMCDESRSRTESTAGSMPPEAARDEVRWEPARRGRSLRPPPEGAEAAEVSELEAEKDPPAVSVAVTGREPPTIEESGRGMACEASQRSRSRASFSNLERS